MSSVQKKTTTKTTKTVTTKTTEHVQSSSDQSQDVESAIAQNIHNLSIVKKGQFFNDTYFEDTRQDFQDAIQEVLTKWGDKSKPTNDINIYRDLRTRDLRDENQAIKSTEDQRYHKIVVDVQDFINGGEVSVKTLDEVEIVVEGRVQRKVGNTTSTKSFKRTFILPDIEPESITSVVSSDGVLIIKALKKVSEEDVSESVTIQKTVVQKQQTSTVETSGQQDVKQIAVTVQEQQPAIASPQPEQQKTVTVTTTTTTSDKSSKPLPIAQKGGFFEDIFFEDCRQHYQQAVKQVLQKFNVTSTETDDLTTYRNLRQKDLREENQVATVDESTDVHKIIVDVKDFLSGGEVTVKTVEEREVVIEGRIEKQEGNKKITKRFCKRFILPEDIEVETVKSVVSSDGVLTITARKKVTDSTVETAEIIQKKVITTVQSQQQVDTTEKKALTDTQQVKVKRIKTKTVTVTTTNVPFFNDPTFAEDVKDFQEAVITITKKMNLTVTDTDAFNAYRKRRKINPRNENQAIAEKQTDSSNKIIMDVCDFIDGVTVKVDEQILTVEGKACRITEGGGSQTFSFNRQFILPDDANPDDITAVITNDGILIITIVTKKTVSSVVTKEVTQVTQVKKDTAEVKEVEPKKVPTEDDTQKTITTTTTTKTTKTVTITTKGPFFNDPTFVEDVKDFQEAITTIIKKFNLTVTDKDVFTTYRNYRKNNPSNENQAITDKETDNTRKIVIDVCDFVGNVTVKVVERELVIEGEGQRPTESGTTQTFRFTRRYSLPEDVNPDDITAVMSSEGILIITIIRRIVKVTKVQKDTTDVKQIETTEKEDTQKVKTTITKTTKTVTITTSKTPFFNDPTLVEDVKDFQEAITTIIKKLNITVTETDVFTSYRNVRKTNPRNENQAVSEKETDTTKKIVMDVCDFIGGVTVKVDEHILTVEGKGNRHTEGGGVQTFSFNRQFILPDDVNPDDITAVITTEGILIITIIRKKTVTSSVVTKETQVTQVKKDTTEVKEIDTKKITTTEEPQKAPAPEEPKPTPAPEEPKPTPAPEAPKPTPAPEEAKKAPILEAPKPAPAPEEPKPAPAPEEPKPAPAPEEPKPAPAPEEPKPAPAPEEPKPAPAPEEPKPAPAPEAPKPAPAPEAPKPTPAPEEPKKAPIQEAPKPTPTPEEPKKAPAPEEPKPTPAPEKPKPTPAPEEPKKAPTPEEPKKTTTEKDETQKTTTTTTKTTRTVTITTSKTPFFKEPTFAEDVKDFQEVITTIIKKLNLTVTEDVFTTYRNYRKTNPKVENQAVSEKDTDTSKKIVIDVCDFVGNVTVKVVERELVIEGEGQRPTETGTTQTFRFTRRFSLPEDVKPEDITAVISSEGILIITIIRRIVKVTTVKKDTKDVKQTETKKTVTEKDDAQKTTTVTTKTTRTVTITKKGPFFNDPTFVEDVKDFQEAITTIIKKLKLTVTKKDVFTTYRDHRKTNPKNENQAVSDKETDTTRKIVLDVCDFVENLTVKVVERELVIEGESKTARFTRRFGLPDDVNPDDITAVMSSEGILIITIIRKVVKVTKVKKDTTDVKQTETKKTTKTEKDEAQKTKTTTTTTKTTKTVTITTKGPFFKDPAFVEDVKNFDQSVTTVIKKFNLKIEKDAYTTYRNYRKANPKNENQAVSEKETDKTKKIVIDVSDFSESVTARVEERDLVIEGEGKRQTATGVIQTFSFNRHFCLPEGVTTDDITAIKSSEGILSVNIKKTVTSSVTTTTQASQESTTGKVINITMKGPFFSDPAFKDSVKEFKTSITTITKKFNVKVTGGDAFTAYRNFRKENPKNENQAVAVNDTEKVKKVVMDVCDFLGAVTVKVEGKEVVVSGTGKRQKGGAGPVITFSAARRFSLYDNTVIDSITAVMSSEGILTLTMPRK